MSQSKRKLEPVRNHPGIYKIWTLSKKTSKWTDTGKFLSTRRVIKNGSAKREKAVFATLPEARDYRGGRIDKSADGPNVHLNRDMSAGIYTFADLVREWKSFHFLKIEPSTSRLYERKIEHLRFLDQIPADQIKASTIDELVKFWMTEFPLRRGRQNFREELKILTTILHFYRRRKNPIFPMPVERDHFEAATIKKVAKNEVKALSREDLLRFFEELQRHQNPILYPLALTEFCLGLRIGEACGLSWEAVDLENGVAKIEQVIVWHDRTWEPSIKKYPKNQCNRHLFMPAVLVQELKRFSATTGQQSGLIFNKNGKPLDRGSIGDFFNGALRRLGIKDVSGTHFLRRTFATLANELTGDFYAVSKVLDHSSTDITQRYVKPMLSQGRKVAEAVNGVFFIPEKPRLIANVRV